MTKIISFDSVFNRKLNTFNDNQCKTIPESNVCYLDRVKDSITKDEAIDVKSLLQDSNNKTADATSSNSLRGLISSAECNVEDDIVVEHSAEPIKSLSDISRISKYLISKCRYRDNMLFIVGINFGLRVSDLRELRFCNLINDNFTFKDTFPVFEKKTRNTRKRKKNRYITINKAVRDAVVLYLSNTPKVSLSDYMFRSESNRGGNVNAPLSNKSVDRILKSIRDELNLNIRMSSHTLRKTFCYWIMVKGNNDQRRLLLLQKMLNHSSPAQTLDYIGLTAEEASQAYRELCLCASDEAELVDSTLYEVDSHAG